MQVTVTLPFATRADCREALIAAALSLMLAAGLLAPRILGCNFNDEDGSCRWNSPSTVSLWLGTAMWVWSLWLAATISHAWLPQSGDQRPLALGLQILALGLLCPALGRLFAHTHAPLVARSLYDLQVQFSYAAVACLSVEFRQRRRRGDADAESLQLDASALARRLDEARTALLQAQVEPHFLFNTLAHLRRLAQTDTQAARAMLSELRTYLAAALPELRQSETSLGREIELVRAFLGLHQRRIGADRLQLSFEIAPGLDEAIVPSTCLLTLAENAVKHGIAPQVEGGAIRVLAIPDPELPDTLRLEVADTGAGMAKTSGGGTGLVTLRARLAALHGTEARLSLHLNEPHGLIARVQLPWR